MVRALRKLKVDCGIDLHAIEVADPDVIDLMLAHRHDIGFAARSRKSMPSDAPDTGKDLPGDQKGEQVAQRVGKEPVFDLDEVVLMAAEGVPAEVVYRIVMEADDLRNAEVLQDRLENCP